MSEKESLVEVYGGVDTHRDCHVAAAVDTAGQVLGTAPFPADATGFEELGGWLRSQGRVVRVGVEGTSSYGAGLTRYLTTHTDRGPLGRGGSDPYHTWLFALIPICRPVFRLGATPRPGGGVTL